MPASDDPLLNAAYVRRLIAEHRAGRDHTARLWRVLAFQVWRRDVLSARAGRRHRRRTLTHRTSACPTRSVRRRSLAVSISSRSPTTGPRTRPASTTSCGASRERTMCSGSKRPGMRTPKLTSAYDRKRLLHEGQGDAARIAAGARPTARHDAAGAAVSRSRRSRSRRTRSLYRFTIGRELEATSARLGAPLLCSFVPQCAPYIRASAPRVHDVLLRGQMVGVRGIRSGDDGARRSASSVETADLVIASAEDLAERCAAIRQQRALRTARRRFRALRLARWRPARCRRTSPRFPEPRVGFFGLIHEWVDVELIGRLADVLPYSFVVIGSAKTDLSRAGTQA